MKDIDEPVEFAHDALAALAEAKLDSDMERWHVMALAAESIDLDRHTLLRMAGLTTLGSQYLQLSVDAKASEYLREEPRAPTPVKDLVEAVEAAGTVMNARRMPRDPELLKAYLGALVRLSEARYRALGDARRVLLLFALLDRFGPKEGAEDLIRRGLRSVGHEVVRMALRKGLSDTSELVREAAVAIAEGMADELVLPILVTFIPNEPSATVRRKMILRLARLNLETASRQYNGFTPLELLVHRIDDNDSSVATAAMLGLSTMAGLPLNLERDFWREWWAQRETVPSTDVDRRNE
jgi:hypothetical protein